MKKLIIFILSVFLCFNQSMVVFAEEEQSIETNEIVEESETIEEETVETEDVIEIETTVDDDTNNNQEDQELVEVDDISEQEAVETEQDNIKIKETVAKAPNYTNATKKNVPSDLSVEDYYGNDPETYMPISSIKISTVEDKEYLNAISEIRFYGCRNITEENKNDYIENEFSTSDSGSKQNRKCYYNFSLYQNDFEVKDGSIYINYEDIIDYFETEHYSSKLMANNILVRLIADGYNNYTTSGNGVRICGLNINLFDGYKQEENNNGDLVFSFTSSGTNGINDKFLTSIKNNGKEITAPDGTIRTNTGYISFRNKNTNDIIDTLYVDSDFYELDLNNHSLTIPSIVLHSLGINNNETYEVRFYLHGFETTSSVEDITFQHQQVNEAFKVSQDENGDVYITSNNPDLLEYLAQEPNYQAGPVPKISIKNSNIKNHTYGNITKKPPHITNHNAYFEVFNDQNEQPAYILIKKEVLLSHNVPTGALEINCEYDGIKYFDEIAVSACKKVPNDIVVRENNNRLEISSSDENYLKSLLMYNINIYHDYDFKGFGDLEELIGGKIVIGSGNGQVSFLKVEQISSKREELFYDETNKVIYITSELLKGNSVGSGDNVSCSLYAYGYETANQTVSISENLGCKNDDVELTIEQNDAGDIIIRCDDSQFIDCLIKETVYSRPIGTEEYGSEVSLRSSSGFYTFRNWVSDHQDIELVKIDANTVKIPYSVVLEQRVKEGIIITSINLNVYGYKKQTIDNVNVIINKGVKEVPSDIAVEENEDGNLVIHSDDLDYLKALTHKNPNDNISSCVQILLKEGTNQHCWFSNYESGFNRLILDENNKTVTVSKDLIRTSSVGIGTHKVELFAFGYNDVSFNIDFVYSCEPAPTGVTAQLDSAGNLIIKTADIEWSDALMSTEHSESDVIFNNEQDYARIPVSSNNLDVKRSNDKKTITLSSKSIIDYGVVNGTYDIFIDVYGYERVVIKNKVKVTKANKPVKADDITISENDDGSIVIACNVAGYIDALAKKTIDEMYSNPAKNKFTSGDSILTIGGCYFNPYESYYNDKLEWKRDPFVVSKDHKSLTLTREAIISSSDVFSKRLTNGTYNFIFNVHGYQLVNKEFEIKHSPIEEEIPNIDDVSVDFTNEGLIISSTNSDWLDGIVKESNHTDTNGFIRLYEKNEYEEAIAKGRDYLDYFYFANDQYDTYIFKGEELKNGKQYVYVPYDYLTALFAGYAWSSENYTDYNGEYHIAIGSCGYPSYDKNEPIDFQLLKEYPSDLEIKQGNNRIEIGSDDDNFLRQLSSDYDDITHWHNFIEVSLDEDFDESISFENTYGVDDEGKECNIIKYDPEGFVYIALEDFNEYFTYDEIENGSLYFNIGSLGYGEQKYNGTLNLDQISYCKDIILDSSTKLTFENYENVTWSSDDENIISVDDEGIITANSLGQTIISAVEVDASSGEAIIGNSISITVTSNKKVGAKLTTEDKNTFAYINHSEQLVFSTTNYTFKDGIDKVTYSSSDNSIAEVDEDGVVKFKKAGIVTLYAEGIGKKASLKISVYSIDKSLKISSTFIINPNDSKEYFEVGDPDPESVGDKKYYLETKPTNGGDVIPTYVPCEYDNSLIQLLTYKSSNDNIVSVNENGELEAHNAGTATITVSLAGDPSSRKATCKVTVVDRVAQSIDKDKLDVEEIDNVISSHDLINNTRDVLIDYSKLVEYTKQDKNNKIHISITDMAIDKNGDSFTPSKMTYQSSDTSIATVDKNGYVTFKKEGQVTITCVVASNPKGKEEVSEDIILRAINYAPKIETTKFTINKYLDSSDVKINVYPIRGSEIDGDSCVIKETNNNPSNYFKIDVKDNQCTLSFRDDIPKQNVPAKSYNQILVFKVGDVEYEYKVNVVVTSVLPSVSTAKVTGNYNSFTGENTLQLSTTVKNGTIKKITPIGNWVEINNDRSIGDPNIDNNKYVTSGKIRFEFEGYTEYGYIEKTIKLPIVSTKPVIKLENASLNLFVPDGTSDKTVTVKLIDKNKQPITTGKVEKIDGLGCEILNDGVITSDKPLTIKITELKKGKINLYYYETDDQGQNKWNDKYKLTLTVNVSNKYPTAKLSSSTVTVNKYFDPIKYTDIILSAPEEVSKVDISNVENMVTYEDGKIRVSSNQDTLPGTYKATITPYIKVDNNDTPLKPITLTVKVNDSIPKLKLKSSTIKLNQQAPEKINIEHSLTNNTYGAVLNSIEIGELDIITINNETDTTKSIQLSNKGKTDKPGNYKVTITPKFNNATQGGNLIEGSPVTLTINVYNKVPTASISLKNAINPLEKDSSSIITTKLSNISDGIKKIEFIDSSLDSLFKIEPNNGNFVLSAKYDADWSNIKDQTLKTNVKVTTNNGEGKELECVAQIKIARKAPSVKLSNPTINLYDSTLLNTPIGSSEIVFDNTKYEIDKQKSEIPGALAYLVCFDETEPKLNAKILDGSKLKSGSTNTFTIKLIWKNDYNNNGKYSKTTTVKLNIKDLSYSIKTFATRIVNN